MCHITSEYDAYQVWKCYEPEAVRAASRVSARWRFATLTAEVVGRVSGSTANLTVRFADSSVSLACSASVAAVAAVGGSLGVSITSRHVFTSVYECKLSVDQINKLALCAALPRACLPARFASNGTPT